MGNTCTSAKSGGLDAATSPPTAGDGAEPSSSMPGTSSGAASNKLRSLELQQQREREAGQQQLREIVAAADRDGLALDWAALIQTAEELHHRDRLLERRRQKMMSKSRSEDRGYWKRLRRKRRRQQQSKSGCSSAASDDTGTGTSDYTIGDRLHQTLERRRRRRAEAMGSFSVNLTIYRNETELPLLHDNYSYNDKLLGVNGDPAAESNDGSQADTAPGLSSVDEETDCSLALSDGFHISTNIGEELETIQE